MIAGLPDFSKMNIPMPTVKPPKDEALDWVVGNNPYSGIAIVSKESGVFAISKRDWGVDILHNGKYVCHINKSGEIENGR